jgi:hypothetical protein
MIKMFVLIYKLFKNIKYMQNKKCSIALKRVLSILPEFTCVSPECHIERKYKVYRLYRYLIWRIWTIGYKTTIFLRYLPYFLNNSQSYSVLNGIMHWKLCSVERVNLYLYICMFLRLSFLIIWMIHSKYLFSFSCVQAMWSFFVL